MSRIYFHSQHGEAEVRGPERAMMGSLCSDLLVDALCLHSAYGADLRSYLTLFPATHYLHQHRTAALSASSVVTAVRVGSEFFTPALNTALVMGSDPVKLCAKLHGQCEIHAYVRGEHRAWLADIIETGRETKIFRADMGWESAIELLRSRADEPVVTSYSVCEHFPNAHVAEFEYDDDAPDAWYDLPDETKWDLALAKLLNERGLEITPETWSAFCFGDGTTGFDLFERVIAARSSTPTDPTS